MEKLIDAMNNTGFEMKESAVARPRYILYRIRPVEGDRLLTNSMVYFNDDMTLAKCDFVTFTSGPNDPDDAVSQLWHWCIDNGWERESLDTTWWQVEVTDTPGAHFTSNALIYETQTLAMIAMLDLTTNWTAICHAQVRPASRIAVAGALAETIHGPNPRLIRMKREVKI